MESAGSRSFDVFVADAGSARKTLDELRSFCLSLGANTVEHVRQHRIVFGKAMAMRWFADISHDAGAVVIKLNEGRRKDPSTIRVEPGSDLRAAYDAISAAYARV